MTLEKINLNDIDTTHCRIVLDKAGRVVDGVNHGRQVIHDEEKDLYYKLFDKDYCRRENFVRAYEAGFFDELAPALKTLIMDEGEIAGYVTEAGSSPRNHVWYTFDIEPLPDKFYNLVLSTAKETGMFFYDLVPLNVIRIKDGELSLIDLESVYDISDETNKFYTTK